MSAIGRHIKEDQIVFLEHPQVHNFVDRTGQKFGRLTVIGYAGQDKERKSMWFCRCKCQKITKVQIANLKKGHTSSCGCINIEKIKERSITHGHSRGGNESPEYRTWQNMLTRTQNPNNKSFPDYGGRGIQVCDRWKDSFENFLADMGKRPKNTSLDRKENNLGYSKENCRWATRKEQSNNKRSNVSFIYAGKTQTLTQWANELGITVVTLWMRLNAYGWPIEKAFNTPIRRKSNILKHTF